MNDAYEEPRISGALRVSEVFQLREVRVCRSIPQRSIDPRIELIDHHRRMAGITLEGAAQGAFDVGHAVQVSGLDVMADKTVEFQAFCLGQMDTLQAADLFDCKIVAHLFLCKA